MKWLATIKHIASKNADYGAAEKYLLFEHDEFTMKPLMDGKGYLIPRSDYRIGAVLTTPDRFASDCMAANLRYGKNRAKGDVKSHHYIISFDPRDGPEHGLTVDRAQKLGMEFCKKYFPGHQALVCTHPDGHNHSGNIHVHIVINSLRIEDVPKEPYMDRSCDTKAGMKHRCTGAAMHYFRSRVMEMCRVEGLYQIDLLSGSSDRVTEREYWTKRKGQTELDKVNREILAAGLKTRMTKFETEKEKLREQIRSVLEKVSDFDSFEKLLLQEYGITVRESRGRFSYLTSERTKPITARKLGDAYEKSAVLEQLEKKRETIWESEGKMPDRSVGQMVNVAQKMAVSRGYGNWAKLHNLKVAARSFVYLNEHGFSSMEELEQAYEAAKQEVDAAGKIRSAAVAKLRQKKELLSHIENFYATKKQRVGYKKSWNKSAYCQSWTEELKKSDAALAYLREQGIKAIPKKGDVQAEIDILVEEEKEALHIWEDKKVSRNELKKVMKNVEQMLKTEQGDAIQDKTPEKHFGYTEEKSEGQRTSILEKLKEKKQQAAQREAPKRQKKEHRQEL